MQALITNSSQPYNGGEFPFVNGINEDTVVSNRTIRLV
jgi:hypothetical protein